MKSVGRKNNTGFSLIEVLVALVVAAVGLLGVAALIVFSMRASFESRQQTIASLLAVDVHERAWLDSHVVPDNDADRECSPNWVQLGTFLPGGGLDDVDFDVGGDFPECTFRVTWEGAAGAVGAIQTFGGEFSHNFIIPSS